MPPGQAPSKLFSSDVLVFCTGPWHHVQCCYITVRYAMVVFWSVFVNKVGKYGIVLTASLILLDSGIKLDSSIWMHPNPMSSLCDISWSHLQDSLHWRHNKHDGVSNHQHHDCLLNRLFRRKSKKTSKLNVTGLCAGNSPGSGEFPAQMASNAENVSIWWRHHVKHDIIVGLSFIQLARTRRQWQSHLTEAIAEVRWRVNA